MEHTEQFKDKTNKLKNLVDPMEILQGSQALWKNTALVIVGWGVVDYHKYSFDVYQCPYSLTFAKPLKNADQTKPNKIFKK